MLFQAMLIFLPISIFFKILSKRGKVHYGKQIFVSAPLFPGKHVKYGEPKLIFARERLNFSSLFNTNNLKTVGFKLIMY